MSSGPGLYNLDRAMAMSEGVACNRFLAGIPVRRRPAATGSFTGQRVALLFT
jgi:hypothetical protein